MFILLFYFTISKRASFSLLSFSDRQTDRQTYNWFPIYTCLVSKNSSYSTKYSLAFKMVTIQFLFRNKSYMENQPTCKCSAVNTVTVNTYLVPPTPLKCICTVSPRATVNVEDLEKSDAFQARCTVQTHRGV